VIMEILVVCPLCPHHLINLLIISREGRKVRVLV
jgi:hypothetical protein